MKFKDKTRTEKVLIVMHIVAWLAFVGFAIEAGAILTSYIVSCINPAASAHMYKQLNLDSLMQFSFLHYSMQVFFLFLIPLIKAYIWYLVIKIASGFDIKNPFTSQVTLKLEKISFLLLGTWIVFLMNAEHSAWLLSETGKQYGSEITGDSIFMAGLVFIISQVFKRGVEIQSEHELTI